MIRQQTEYKQDKRLFNFLRDPIRFDVLATECAIKILQLFCHRGAKKKKKAFPVPKQATDHKF